MGPVWGCCETVVYVVGLEFDAAPIPTPRQQQIQNGTVTINTQQIRLPSALAIKAIIKLVLHPEKMKNTN